MKKIQVEINGKILTYETDLKVRKGTQVVLPPTYWMDARDTQIGKVVSLTSDYTGYCVKVLSVIKK
jgi:hypothetical protein